MVNGTRLLCTILITGQKKPIVTLLNLKRNQMIGNLEPEERILNLKSEELRVELEDIYNDIEQLAFRIYMTGYNKGVQHVSE